MRLWVLLWVWVVGLAAAVTSEWSYEGATITLAHLNISYVDPATGHHRTDIGEVGKFASGAVGVAAGVLVVGHTVADGGGATPYNRHGCSTPWADPPPAEPWVALVSRGRCSDQDKVSNAMSLNASAILVYARDTQAHLKKMAHSFSNTQGVVVFLGHQQGEQLARLVENGTKIYITINKGQEVKYKITDINRTSVLFVSVSFIILMVISLAWLLFYYIQRFRYIHAKDRLARHLCNAAKKALGKIPVKNLKSGDKEVATESECCAVCIEPYQVSDIVRTLPCQHEYHKNCVDPWLLEHRTCPMCKMDILRFYGYVFTGSTETVLPIDEIEYEITLSDSEESVLQLDMMEDTSTGETEGHLPTTPPPPAAHTRSMPHVSQVMVVSQAETTGSDTPCDEGQPDSPIPDTPISPVHQLESPVPLSSATTSGFLSIINSAKNGRASQCNEVTISSVVPQPSRTPTPQVDIEVCVEDGGAPKLCACDTSQNKNDVEVSSVCSDDFSDALSSQSASDAVEVDTRLNSQVNTATNCSYIATCENEPPTPFCVSVSSTTPSVPSSAQTRSPSRTGSPSHKGSASRRKLASQKRSSSRKRSLSRARSNSRRRSASHARSPSRGRSNARQDSPSHSMSTAFSRSAREQSRPSSLIINVSHV